MNKDHLIAKARQMVSALSETYTAPTTPSFNLATPSLMDKMNSFMTEGVERGDFTPHNRTVALAIGAVMVAKTGEDLAVSEQDIYDRERANFIQLAQTKNTHDRIVGMLDFGDVPQN